MRKFEMITREITVETETSWTCDRCGKEYVKDNRNYPHDGLIFAYRRSEEDEIIVVASDICDDCYMSDLPDNDMHLKIQEIAEKIREIFPHASVSSRMLDWGMTGEFVEE